MEDSPRRPTLSKFLSFRLTEEEDQRIRELAAARGMPVTALLRALVVDELEVSAWRTITRPGESL